MTNAITIVDPFSGSKAIVIEHAFDILAAGSGTLKDFAVWSESESSSLEGIKSAISNPSLVVIGPEPLDDLVWADFQKLSYEQGSVDSKADFYNEKIVSSIDFRLNGFEEKVLGFGKARRRPARYDPDSRDGDADLRRQEGTRWERPVGPSRLVAALRERRAAKPVRRQGILDRIANAVDVPSGSSPAVRAARGAPAPRASQAVVNVPPPPSSWSGPSDVQVPDAPRRQFFASALERLAGRIDPGGAPKTRRAKKWGIQDYQKGLKHVYQNGGDITDVADEHIIDVLFDENLELATPSGVPLTKESLVMAEGPNGLMRNKTKFKNRRFNFEVIKDERNIPSVKPWRVLRVVDSVNNDVWYVKVSTYGNNDALLENIGNKASEVLGFGNRENNFRVGQSVDRAGSARPYRWMMMRSIDDWEFDHKPSSRAAGKWEEWAINGSGAKSKKVDPGDVARMLVMDYIFDNTDRHLHNFMARTDEDGRLRLGLIDNGLLYGGSNPVVGTLGIRLVGQLAEREKVTPVSYKDYARSAVRRPFEYRNLNLLNDVVRSRKFNAAVENAIERLETSLDMILSVDRISSKGKILTSEELQHLEAVRIVAEARLQALKDKPSEVLRQLRREIVG